MTEPNAFERLLLKIRSGDLLSIRVGMGLFKDCMDDKSRKEEAEALADALHEGSIVRIHAGEAPF
jgi:hypothetical protein